MLTQNSNSSPAQIKFDETYITAAQIMQDLKISRPALLYARRAGKLPSPIIANAGHLLLWELADIGEYLKEWKIALNARRGS